MYLHCDACDHNLLVSDCGCSEKARQRAREQRDKIHAVELERDRIGDVVKTILTTIAERESLTGEHESPSVQVDRQALLKLWDAAECYERKVEDRADDFLYMQMVRTDIIIEAVELFHKENARWKNHVNDVAPFALRLQRLRNALVKYYEFNGWKVKMDLSAEEVAKAIASENA